MVTARAVTDVGTAARARAHPPEGGAPGLLESAGRLPMLTLAIAGAWLLIAIAQLTGTAALLHHHALIEHGPPPAFAVPAFLAAWLVMIVAMMVPASLPAVAAYIGLTRDRPLLPFLAPYAVAWLGFGLAVFFGDALLHRLVHATPWLEARPWSIDASVFAIAGLYQLTPFKRRSLDACRHPARLVPIDAAGPRDAHPGVAHAGACLAASWALMLLMFGEGFSNPMPMLGLSVVMAYEATGRHGHLVRRLVGLGLLLLAAGVAVSGVSV